MAELRLIERRGDPVPVMIVIRGEPVFIWHTPAEYAALWQGVNLEVCEALEKEFRPNP